jgi:hypothetical protein
MAKDFTVPSNPASEKIVREAISFTEMLERLKASQGRGDVAGAPAPAPEPAAAVALSADSSQRRAYRVVYPSGNNRFEIYGVSEADLDEQEKRIRAMYGA